MKKLIVFLSKQLPVNPGRRGSIISVSLFLLLIFLPAQYALARNNNDVTFSNPAFQRVWERTDKPVASGMVARSWLWGQAPFKNSVELYAGSPGGQRQVEYFDKARMEINNPDADTRASWYVTNGLLVVEMMTGRIQTGDTTFVQRTPSGSAVAGDNASINPGSPTYEAMARVATLSGNNNQATNLTGSSATMYISHAGDVSNGDAHGVKYAYYDPTLHHNIADVFWTFMNKQGLIWDAGSGGYRTASVFDWVFVMGLPVTDPYWGVVRVGGQDKLVLMQAFQRRLLTYTPSNDPAWRVEMGNVGRHYDDWRNGGTSNPTPGPSADWLVYLNSYRALGNLPSLTENPAWSADDVLHSRYVIKNDAVVHDEDPNNPWYTRQGNDGGMNGNVVATSDLNFSDRDAIDTWMSGPFHMIGIMDPQLHQTGFGAYHEPAPDYQSAATLDVLRGLGPVGASVTYPVEFPAQRKTTWLKSFTGNEVPDPLSTCANYTVPTGAPIVLELTTIPLVTAHSLNKGGVSLSSCIFDETTYTNSNNSIQTEGRAILEMRHAIMIIPRAPLVQGTYNISITTNGTTYNWSFNVAP